MELPFDKPFLNTLANTSRKDVCNYSGRSSKYMALFAMLHFLTYTVKTSRHFLKK